MAYGDDGGTEMFEMVLNRLIEVERERSKFTGTDTVASVVRDEMRKVIEESRRLQRLINERPDTTETNALLREIKAAIPDIPEVPDYLMRITNAITDTDPIPF